MKDVLFLIFLSFKLIKATEYCSGFETFSLGGRCVHNDFERESQCRDPIKEGTVATLSCKDGYKKPYKNITDRIFCKSGSWDHEPFQCEPICGIHYPYQYNSEVPWRVQIHKRNLTLFGGTILNEKLVISSASSVWDEENERVSDPSSVFVTYGFYTYLRYVAGHRDISEIAEINVPNNFKGIEKSKEDDIAILVLKRYIVFEYNAAPVCIEWLNGRIVESGFDGKFVSSISSDFANTDCKNSIVSNDDNIFKLICKHNGLHNEIDFGMQGSGFVIEKILNGQKIYFLRGILSSVTIANISNPNQHSVSVINIQHHSELISEYLTKYSGNVINNEWKSILLTCEVPFIPNAIISVEDEHGMKINLSPGDNVPDTSKIVYSCRGDRVIRGTTTNFCNHINWAENHPVCIDTGNIRNTAVPTNGACIKPDIPKLIITTYLEKEITDNFVQNSTTVMYKCAMHYHLEGIERNLCLNGQWKRKRHPSCLSLYENPPTDSCQVPLITYSIIVLEGPMKRNVSMGNYVESSNSITYSCLEKYLLHGVQSNYCYEGHWVAEHPKCVPLTIDEGPGACELPNIQNGFTIITEALKKNIYSPVVYVPDGMPLSYRCKKNYFLEGAVENYCSFGRFENDHSKCVTRSPNDCEIPVIADAIISLQGEVQKIVSFGSYVENFNTISYKCKAKHVLQGTSINFCDRGKWTEKHPTCIKYCSSHTLKGITFSATCEFNKFSKPCDGYLTTGTIAKIFCQHGYRKPNQLVRNELICNEFGHWDHNPYRCEPECGTEVTQTIPYIKGGDKSNITAVPWHIAIYSLIKGRPTQICGGTILNAKLVLSAAHCFWQTSNSIIDPSYIMVAAGKYYRNFQAEEPLSPQFFNVSEIIIPEGFQGPLQNYRDDIAILVLGGYIEYKPYIKPICIEWLDLEEKTVGSGLEGRIAGWGRTSSDLPSKELKLLDISTLSYADCIAAADVRFRDKIAGDKFCISSQENESVCPGDSGGGFAIPRMVNGIKTYFLWGIISNGYSDNNDCNSVNLTTLTNIQHYHDLITNNERKHYYN